MDSKRFLVKLAYNLANVRCAYEIVEAEDLLSAITYIHGTGGFTKELWEIVEIKHLSGKNIVDYL